MNQKYNLQKINTFLSFLDANADKIEFVDSDIIKKESSNFTKSDLPKMNSELYFFEEKISFLRKKIQEEYSLLRADIITASKYKNLNETISIINKNVGSITLSEITVEAHINVLTKLATLRKNLNYLIKKEKTKNVS